MPANYLLVRGPGVGAPKLKKYSGWLAFSYSPLEKGFAKASEMRMYSFNYPKFSKLDFYEHSRDGLSRACKNAVKVIKKNYKDYNYAYIHFKETDTPGHDNKPHEKKEMIEAIDSLFFGFLRKFCPSKKIKVLVSSDHSTPCKLKTHSADPVPVLFYDPTVSSLIREKSFSEKEARRGALGRFEGHELLKKTGFVK